MKKALTFLSAAVLVCSASAAMAEKADFKALFNSNVDKVKFYACEQGDSFESACSSLFKKSYLVFKKNGTAIVCFGECEKKATWTVSKEGIRVKEPTGDQEYYFSEGQYLHYDDEETGDLMVYKLSKASQSQDVFFGQAPLVQKEDILRETAASGSGLVVLKVTGTSVRLRKGPGTSYDVAGMADAGGRHGELVASGAKAAGDGRQWYHVLYMLESPEAGYSRQDAWICADYVA
ncbi:MAG: hypothetical protein IKX75_01780, partial [Desulfovibrio sp.]|nr:hypothetical protein [Desulfovibrio sp.]